MQGNNKGADVNVVRNRIDFFSASLIAVVIVSVVVVVYMYGDNFESGLSRSVESWAAFGGFMGGLFGPLISFLTLLAILKTIGLQKILLDTQRSEFKAMQSLQDKTLESQLAQIHRANAEADRRVIEETRLNILRTLEHSVRALNQELEIKRRKLDMLLQWVMDGKSGPTPEEVEKLQGGIRKQERRIAAMSMLYDTLCFEDYECVGSIKAAYKSGMEVIWGQSSIDS